MINTLETKLQEGNSNGRTEVTEIVNHKDTDMGPVDEKISMRGGYVEANVILYPINSSIQKIEAKRKYHGNDPLKIRADAASFIHDFEKNYCQEHRDDPYCKDKQSPEKK